MTQDKRELGLDEPLQNGDFTRGGKIHESYFGITLRDVFSKDFPTVYRPIPEDTGGEDWKCEECGGRGTTQFGCEEETECNRCFGSGLDPQYFYDIVASHKALTALGERMAEALNFYTDWHSAGCNCPACATLAAWEARKP